MKLNNYYPNARFLDTGRQLVTTRCTVYASSDYNPAVGQHPGIMLTATEDGDNWAQMDISVPANMKIVAACTSVGYSAETASSTGSVMQLWATDGKTPIANVDPGWNKVSPEFTAPSNGVLRVTFRAPKTNGKSFSVMNVFIGTLADWQQLGKILPTPWFDLSIMRLIGGGA
ncbi:hypothetical protein KIH79_06675 [Bifidobacterium sp. 82T10]|uniref:Uncharacterized protein n=1 Tax=Bifidobacterium miconis TaxID=2834435 RepID=A0ABS6WF07_9BIFI|nr:hypothetical protein [Bifidobacterium miconis]MBW3092634.1 hypothetical protein [Bifidobacterium miconis]